MSGRRELNHRLQWEIWRVNKAQVSQISPIGERGKRDFGGLSDRSMDTTHHQRLVLTLATSMVSGCRLSNLESA
jgi:hypothetical protein